MAAFCTGAGILVLEMKPREALPGWIPFCAIHCDMNGSGKPSKHDRFGNTRFEAIM